MNKTKVKNSEKVFYFLSKNYLIIISLAYFLRCLPLIIHPTLWAEDGNVFYGPLLQHDNSFVDFLFSTYSGQRFTLQFVIAKALLVILDSNLTYLPILSTVVCIVFTFGLAAIWLRSEFLITSITGRRLVFGYVLLAPSAWEPLGNLTNLHGYLLLGLIGLAGWNTSKNKSWIPLFLLVAGASLMTSVNGIFLIGVLAFSGYLNKKNFILPIIGASILVGFQANAWSARTSGMIPESLITQLANTLIVAVKRIGAEIVVGQSGGIYLSQFLNNQVWFFIGIVPLVFFCIIMKKASLRESSLFSFLFILAILISYFTMIVLVSRKLGTKALVDFGGAGRYFLIVHVLVFLLFVIAVEKLPKKRSLTTSVATYSLIILFLLGVATDFYLKDKSNNLTRSSWASFSRCIKLDGKNCSAIVPPGQTWGVWGIRLD